MAEQHAPPGDGQPRPSGTGLVALWSDEPAAASGLTDLARAWCRSDGITRTRCYDHITGGSGSVLLAETASVDAARRLASNVVTPDGATLGTYRHLSRRGALPVELGGSPYLFTVRVWAPEEWVQPLREWLHGEHFERQVTTPGIAGCRGYESVAGPFHFLNIWAVDDPGVPTSEEYAAIRATPWYERVAGAFEASRVVRAVSCAVRPADDGVEAGP